MNVEKVYNKKYAELVNRVRQQLRENFSHYDFQSLYSEYDISNKEMLDTILSSVDRLESQIKRALENKDKNFMKALDNGFTLNLEFDKNNYDCRVFAFRILGDTLKISPNGQIVLPTDLTTRVDKSNYIRDKDTFGPVLDKIMQDAIDAGNVNEIFEIFNSKRFTEQETDMALPYVVNKAIKQMQKQAEYEVGAKKQGLPFVEPCFRLEYLLGTLNDYLGARTDEYSTSLTYSNEKNEHLIEVFKNSSAAPRLKAFIDTYFNAMIDGKIDYDIYKTTAYIDCGRHYADLFYTLDMLSIEDFKRAQEYRDVGYQLKGDTRGGGKPNEHILEELRIKELTQERIL